MKGERELWAMRRAGKKPAYIWVSDFPNCALDGLTVRVAGESPDLLDLRFLVGTTVIVEGPDGARVERLAKACGAHARRVIASTITRQAGWAEVVCVTDTEGVMTWPA